MYYINKVFSVVQSVRFLFVCLCLTLSGCASLPTALKSPEVNLTSLELLPSTGIAQKFKIGLSITNPNTTALKLVGMSYDINLEGQDFISGVSNKIPVLEPYTETDVVLEASANLFKSLKVIERFLKGNMDAINYGFNAELDFGTFTPNMRVKKDGVISLTQ